MANGWTAERRARQAAMIRTWKPWEWSTGPQTIEGKLCSSQNAIAHGGYSQDSRRIKDLLREFKESMTLVRQ